MDDGYRNYRQRESTGLGWFYVGLLLGTLLSTGAVVVATEVQYRRRLRRLRRADGDDTGLFESEMDIVEGLSQVVSEGLGVMADAVARIGESFSGQRREAIRYDLGMGGASGHGGSSHGWYTGEDEDEEQFRAPDGQGSPGAGSEEQQPAGVRDGELGGTAPLPS